jgi:hypothetical protein
MEVFPDFKVDNDNILSKKEVIELLKNNLMHVEKYVKRFPKHGNKYLDLAIKYNMGNYMVGSIAELHSLDIMKSLSYFIKKFFNEHGEFLAVFNELNGKPTSIVFRSIYTKAFLDYSYVSGVYGLDLIDENFVFGKTLIITEGIYDADVFRNNIYNNIISTLTSNLTLLQAEILCTLTDKFILAFDNDKGGMDGIEVATKRLRKTNPKVIVEILNPYYEDKDLGQLEEVIDPNEKELRLMYYKNMLGALVYDEER